MPKGVTGESSVESSHLPKATLEPQPSSRRPARRRRNASSKKEYVKKSDLGSPNSQQIEVGFPSSAEEQDGVQGKAVESKEDQVGEASSEGGGVVDVISVLEELQLAAKELELSADQLRVNDQLQEDELLALESIYGEKVVILDRQKGLRSFQIYIETKVSEDFAITTNLNSSRPTKTESTSTDDFSYSFEVKFLPPIVLTCTFPTSYPSHKPPYFTISVQWLDSLRISELCSVLDSIWMEQQGQEVMYQWVDYLQSNSLSHLGIHQEMVLGPYGTMHTRGDRRAVSGIVSPDVDIPSLKRYNDEQGGPGSKCEGITPPSVLKQLLGDEEYERYESVMLEKTLECMPDAVYCPRCDTICFEDEEHFAHCHNCFNSFSSICKEKRHLGVPCLTPELKM